MRMKHGSDRGPTISVKPRLLAAFTAVAMMFATAVPALMPKAANADDRWANGSICVPEDKPLGDDTSNAKQDNGIATWVGKDMYIGYPSAGVKANYGNGGNTPGQSYAVEAEGATLVGGRLAIHSVKNSWGANYGPNGVNYSGRGFRFGIVGFGGQFRPTEGDALVIAGSNSQMSGMVDKDGNAVNVLGWNDRDNLPGRGRGWIGANKEGEPNYTAKIAGGKSAAMGLYGLKPGTDYPGPDWSWTSVYNNDVENNVQWGQTNPLKSVNISGETKDRNGFGTTIATQSDQLAALTPNGTYTTTASSQSNYKRTKYNSGKETTYTDNSNFWTRTIIEATFNVNERVIKFTGDGESKLQVFNLPATELRNNGKDGVSFAFEKIPTGASIVINVTGEENIEFNNGWRFWWAGDKELGNNWDQYEIGNGYSLYDNTSKAKQKAYVAAMSAIMWNFNKTASLTIKGGQAINANVIAKKEYKHKTSPTASWFDGKADGFPAGDYSNTASVFDDPAAAMLGSIMMPNTNGAFDDHVTTNGRVWVNGNFYMNNPTKAYTFGDNVGEGDSASIIDMDQERHNKGWNATVKTDCPTISWEKVDGDGNVISGLPDGSTLASFQVFGSKDDAVNNRNVLVTVTDNQPLVDQDQAQGKFQIQNLGKNATYYIKEITAPTGYVPSANIYQIVTGNSYSENYSEISNVYTAQGIKITNAADKDLSGTSGIVNKSGGADVEWGKYADGDASYAGLSGSEWTLTRTDSEPKQEWTIRDYTAQVTGVEILHDGTVTQSLELTTGSHAQLSANVLPVGEAIQDVRWSSSNPGLVSVSPTGEVVVLRNTADNEDPNVTITAESVSNPDKKATITIVCKSIAVNSVVIQMNGSDAPNAISMEKGTRQQLSVKTDPLGVSVVWKSSNEQAVSVSADGMLTANGAGTATITADATPDSDAPHDVNPEVGRFKLTNLPDGVYKLKEHTAPEGYYLNPQEYTVTIKDGKVSWSPNAVDENGIVWISDKPTQVAWEKVDSDNDNAPLAGSGWTIEQKSIVEGKEKWAPINEVLDCTKAPCNASVTYKDEDPAPGKFLVKKLPVGEYRISETTVPDGYETPKDANGNPVYYPFEITQDGQEAVPVSPKPLGNKRTTGTVNWKKVSSEDSAASKKPLAGSEWQLTYTSYDKITNSDDTTTPKETIICQLTDTGSSCTVNGESKNVAWAVDQDSDNGEFSYAKLPWGDYVIVETKAPDGYNLDTTEHRFTIGLGSTEENKFEVSLGDIENTPGVVLPATGGEGNTLIVLFGFALIAISMVGCGVAMRKRI
ncbi:SpaA isopeptide-forming pilin-related protein [Bifidobacterium pseudolongum]|uniref:SpaA isopeptide-forming pilin-related protein n=1 Tax=Bifidobacterium pseudolongum TaxID=1694 RepID=UPI003510E5BB